VVRGRVKGRPEGLWGRFYSVKKARGGDGQSNGHQWPWGGGLDCIKGSV
jgi:hypothetical protein